MDGEYLAPFNAVQVDSGWYESSWFGTFKRANYNWIYHTELQWLFVEKSTSLGTWFWSEKLGWGGPVKTFGHTYGQTLRRDGYTILVIKRVPLPFGITQIANT